MKGESTAPATVEAYIAEFPEDVQAKLEAVRRTIREAVPEARESIAYGMPAYKLKGKPLIYFGAHANHLGLYPTPEGIEAFQEDLAPYKSGKGSARFPFDQPLPFDLITKIVEFKAREILAHAKK